MRWTKGEMVFAAVMYTGLLWLLAAGYNWLAEYWELPQRTSLKWLLITPLIAAVFAVVYFAIVAVVKRVARAVLHPRIYESLVRERGTVQGGQGQRASTPTDPR